MATLHFYLLLTAPFNPEADIATTNKLYFLSLKLLFFFNN